MKTADAGYLTRRLVDIAQDVVVNEEDCGTINGIEYSAVKSGDEVIESLSERIVGKYTLERVEHPISHELLIDVNEYITDEIAAKIEEAGVQTVKLRTVLTCESKHGVCVKCYGRNLARNKIVEIGEAVGIIAAQSIGQPGTQLTMRTFHVGGTASSTTEENHITFKYPVIIKDILGTSIPLDDGNLLFTRRGTLLFEKVLKEYTLAAGDSVAVETGVRILRDDVLYTAADGTVIKSPLNAFAYLKGSTLYLTAPEQKTEIRNGSTVVIKKGDYVPATSIVATFDPYNEPILAEQDGFVRFEDIIPGSTPRRRSQR